MLRATLRIWWIGSLLVLSAMAASASLSSVTNPITLSVEDGREPAAPDVAADGGARFVVVWRDKTDLGDTRVLAQRVDGRTGGAVGPPRLVGVAEVGVEISDPKVAVDAAGRYAVVWGELRSGQSCLASRRFDLADVSLPPFSLEACRAGVPLAHPDIAYGKGRFVVVWERQTPGAPARIAVARFDEAGSPFASPFLATQIAESGGTAALPAVASDANGSFSIAWEVRYPNGHRQVVERSYNRAGQARNAGATSPAGLDFFGAAVGAGADRAAFGFAETFAEGTRTDVALLWHPEARLAAVSELFIPGDAFLEANAVGTPALAMDYQGRIAFAWTCAGRFEPTSNLCGITYTRRGVPKGGVLGFDGRATSPSIAFGRDSLLGAWVSLGEGGATIAAELEAVRRQDELCVYRSNRFNCGAFFLVQEVVTFGSGVARGDLPLLADFDGNGDQDPCVFRAGQFLCDTGHDGGAPDLVRRFGRAGDTPLAGDLDGDGRDDACVHRGRSFLCDTAGNGGAAEVTINFGLATDVPILADTDGDGRDDPCVYRASLKSFLCDRDHDGVADWTVIVPDALAGDKPLIADFGGAGFDGFYCVVRGTRLLCKNGPDPAAALEAIPVTRMVAGDVPMIGDIDGL